MLSPCDRSDTSQVQSVTRVSKVRSPLLFSAYGVSLSSSLVEKVKMQPNTRLFGPFIFENHEGPSHHKVCSLRNVLQQLEMVRCDTRTNQSRLSHSSQSLLFICAIRTIIPLSCQNQIFFLSPLIFPLSSILFSLSSLSLVSILSPILPSSVNLHLPLSFRTLINNWYVDR